MFRIGKSGEMDPIMSQEELEKMVMNNFDQHFVPLGEFNFQSTDPEGKNKEMDEKIQAMHKRNEKNLRKLQKNDARMMEEAKNPTEVPHLERAEVLLELGRPREAVQCLTNALAISLSYKVEKKQMDLVSKLMRAVEPIPPKAEPTPLDGPDKNTNPTSLFEKALIQPPGPAFDLLTEAIRVSEKPNPEFYAKRGEIALVLGKPEFALKDFTYASWLENRKRIENDTTYNPANLINYHRGRRDTFIAMGDPVSSRTEQDLIHLLCANAESPLGPQDKVFKEKLKEKSKQLEIAATERTAKAEKQDLKTQLRLTSEAVQLRAVAKEFSELAKTYVYAPDTTVKMVAQEAKKGGTVIAPLRLDTIKQVQQDRKDPPTPKQKPIEQTAGPAEEMAPAPQPKQTGPSKQQRLAAAAKKKKQKQMKKAKANAAAEELKREAAKAREQQRDEERRRIAALDAELAAKQAERAKKAAEEGKQRAEAEKALKAAEDARLAREKAEREAKTAEDARVAKEKAAREAKPAEDARIAREKADREAKAAEDARIAKEKADREAKEAAAKRIAEEKERKQQEADELKKFHADLSKKIATDAVDGAVRKFEKDLEATATAERIAKEKKEQQEKAKAAEVKSPANGSPKSKPPLKIPDSSPPVMSDIAIQQTIPVQHQNGVSTVPSEPKQVVTQPVQQQMMQQQSFAEQNYGNWNGNTNPVCYQQQPFQMMCPAQVFDQGIPYHLTNINGMYMYCPGRMLENLLAYSYDPSSQWALQRNPNYAHANYANYGPQQYANFHTAQQFTQPMQLPQPMQQPVKTSLSTHANLHQRFQQAQQMQQPQPVRRVNFDEAKHPQLPIAALDVKRNSSLSERRAAAFSARQVEGAQPKPVRPLDLNLVAQVPPLDTPERPSGSPEKIPVTAKPADAEAQAHTAKRATM